MKPIPTEALNRLDVIECPYRPVIVETNPISRLTYKAPEYEVQYVWEDNTERQTMLLVHPTRLKEHPSDVGAQVQSYTTVWGIDGYPIYPDAGNSHKLVRVVDGGTAYRVPAQQIFFDMSKVMGITALQTVAGSTSFTLLLKGGHTLVLRDTYHGDLRAQIERVLITYEDPLGISKAEPLQSDENVIY